ncbi:hypothetical protein [Oscillatoria nigro-viridis]|uniref:hypothetical protein n=1 Tax=Phormidium nigroviride TaxID=482564 RepID=UPI0005A2E3E8|nr:hypothetical protein [Oscillatoria nigro-viridis]
MGYSNTNCRSYSNVKSPLANNNLPLGTGVFSAGGSIARIKNQIVTDVGCVRENDITRNQGKAVPFPYKSGDRYIRSRDRPELRQILMDFFCIILAVRTNYS